jgi:UDP-N-acetyl-D-galactosamine dehydrogenase
MNLKIAIIGLGYVGLPLLFHLSKKIKVYGYDINNKIINSLKKGIDHTNEIDESDFHKNPNFNVTNQINDINNFDIYIVTVPTPVDDHNVPNLTALKESSKAVAGLIKKGSFIVYESTVYPGCTEEVCIPIIESISKLKLNKDFICGYSPERINPGDKVNTLLTTTKIISASNSSGLKLAEKIYNGFLGIKIHKAPTIKVAEAAKVIENVQRDVNIGLINELSILFTKMGISTSDVLDAASTKWNFLNFTPGLVGGHCIGIDPYYLTYKADLVRYNPQVILSGRRINDNMGRYYAKESIKFIANSKKNLKNLKLLILGATFKENCPDTRNSRVFDIVDELELYGVKTSLFDPYINQKNISDIKTKYQKLFEYDFSNIKGFDFVMIAVKHDQFCHLTNQEIKKIIKNKQSIIYDIKNCLNKEDIKLCEYRSI